MIVFDLDDTLYKEADYVKSGVDAVCNRIISRGLLSSDEATRICKTAKDTAGAFDALITEISARHGQELLTINDILKIYRNHMPSLKLDKVTEKALTELHRAGNEMGIITDGRSVTQRNKIKALGLDRFFRPQNILISEETGASKHDRIAFERMMELNPSEKTFTYVGDNPYKDFLWPNRLGWYTVMLRDNDGRNIHPQPKENTYTTEIDHSDSENTSYDNTESPDLTNLYLAKSTINSLSDLPGLIRG